MPYQVSMMGWVGSGEDFCGLGWVQKFWVGFWKSDSWPTRAYNSLSLRAALSFISKSSSASTPLVGWQEWHLVCKSLRPLRFSSGDLQP